MWSVGEGGPKDVHMCDNMESSYWPSRGCVVGGVCSLGTGKPSHVLWLSESCCSSVAGHMLCYVSSMASHRGSNTHVVAGVLQRTSTYRPSAVSSCHLPALAQHKGANSQPVAAPAGPV